VTPNLSRRAFLQSSSAALAAGFLPESLLQGKDPKKPRTQRVVLIAFAGGVRSKDVIGKPENVPNLMRIAQAGCVLPNMHAANVGHFGATLSLFTGNTEVMGIRENERSLNPTLFEYLRKDHGFTGGDCWLSTAGGAQARLFAYSGHAEYGEAFGANLIDGDGVFNAEFKSLTDKLGRPRVDTPQEEQVQIKLLAALEPRAALDDKNGRKNDPEAVRRIEKFIVEELTGTTTRITGPGAGDAKSVRIGMNILRIFKPKVLGITLQGHDVAHAGYNGYVEVIRRNDQEIGRLWDAIQQDQDLRDTTAVMVLPEFGRDKNLNERQGLDHGDGSEELRKVFLIAAGPEFKKGKVLTEDCRTYDVTPTVLSLFGAKAKFSKAPVLRNLFA
jgi:hypothetical protein